MYKIYFKVFTVYDWIKYSFNKNFFMFQNTFQAHFFGNCLPPVSNLHSPSGSGSRKSPLMQIWIRIQIEKNKQFGSATLLKSTSRVLLRFIPFCLAVLTLSPQQKNGKNLHISPQQLHPLGQQISEHNKMLQVQRFLFYFQVHKKSVKDPFSATL